MASIVDLGTFGGNDGVAKGINDSGQVVGYSITATGSQHAFLWTPTTPNGTTGTMMDLGTLGGDSSTATGINDLGEVVGYSSATDGGSQHAFLWTPTTPNGTTGTMTDLSTLSTFGPGGWDNGSGINDSGQVIGAGSSSNDGILDTGGALTDLGTLGGKSSVATAINDSGQVVGYSSNTDVGSQHAFLWTPTTPNGTTGAMTDLDTLGEGSLAYGISDSGDVVGLTSSQHAFLWTPTAPNGTTGTMTDLGTLGGFSIAYGVNDSGQVVGYASTAGPTVAFLYSHETGMIDLNSILPANSGWLLHEATAINNRGQIVGEGLTGSQGHAFLLNLSSAPDIIMTSASVSGTQTVNLNYSISGGDLGQPFQAAVYRSPTSTFDINTAVPTGIQATIPAVDSAGNSSTTPGDHSVMIKLSSAIGPDSSGQDPYVFVVANPPGSSHIPESDDPNDSNNAALLGLVDLAATIDSSKIVPTKATDLNLYSFFGTEQVNVPVTIKNQGSGEAKGDVTATVYLSTSQDFDPNNPNGVVFAKKQMSGFDLRGGGNTNVVITGSIDGSKLTIGKKYYFVTQITSTTIKESDVGPDGEDTNNIAATDRAFEYLGTPDYPRLFDDGTYFKFILDTLQGNLVAKAKYRKIILSDPHSFIGNFEGDSLSPYLDSKGIPTISVGVNIQAQIAKGTKKISPLGHSLASYVRSFRHLSAKMSDLSVLNWIQTQARQHHWTKANQGPPFVSKLEDNALFLQAFKTSLTKAQASVGGAGAYNTLSGYIKTVLVDVAHNHGSVYPDMASYLTGSAPDYVLAAFNMLDQPRSNTYYDTKSPGFKTRLEAEYENLLIEHKSQLGKILH